MSMIYFTKRVNSVKDLFYKNVEYKTLHGLSNDLQKKKIGCVNTIFVYHKKGGRFDMNVVFIQKIQQTKMFKIFIKEHYFVLFVKRCKFASSKIQPILSLLPICFKQNI